MTQIGNDVRLFLPLLIDGLWTTVLISMCALVTSVMLGLLWALMARSPRLIWRSTSAFIVTTVRGIPIIVQLFYVYFVLPGAGLNLPAFAAGVVGLGLAYSVYQAENFRAGFDSVDHPLIETAQALGMNELQIFLRVVTPLALKAALPPFGNTAIMLLKDSSIASTITVAELTRAGQLIAFSTFKNMTVYSLIAVLYLILSLPLTFAVRALEKRLQKR